MRCDNVLIEIIPLWLRSSVCDKLCMYVIEMLCALSINYELYNHTTISPFKSDELMLSPFKGGELMLSPFMGDELMLSPF